MRSRPDSWSSERSLARSRRSPSSCRITLRSRSGQQPITVTFDAPHSDRLRVDFSDDGGITWKTVAASIDAEAGSFTFTPDGIPTPRAS